MYLFLYVISIYLLIGLYFSIRILTLKEFHKQRKDASRKELILFFLYITFVWVRNIKFHGSKIMFEYKNDQ
jgi:hypothetical protein